MEYDIALLKSWQQNCSAERVQLKLTTSAKVAAWSTLAFLILGGLVFVLGRSPGIVSDNAMPLFVVSAVGLGCSFIATAILTQKSKTRAVLCSSCKHSMKTVVRYREKEDLAHDLGDNAKWYNTQVFSDGVCGWKPKKNFRGTTKIQLYWDLPRELWRVCSKCQKAFLDQKDGPMTSLSFGIDHNRRIDPFAGEMPFTRKG